MGKEKRQRQKAARAARIQAEQKKRSRQENIKRLGIGVGMALVLVAVLVTCSLRGGKRARKDLASCPLITRNTEISPLPVERGAASHAGDEIWQV